MSTKQPEALRLEYRATMPTAVLHLWAADALACITELEDACRTNIENYEFQRSKADRATATVYQFHYAMKDAGWHPGRTDDDLTQIIRQKGRELADLQAQLAAIGAGGVGPLRQINQPEPTVPDQTQDWAGMDGATAYLLIQRHADNWADVAKMMGEWLTANQRQSFDAEDMATASAQGFRDGVASVAPPAAQAGGWISVDERLPEPDGPVLAHNGKWTGVAAWMSGEYLEPLERWQDGHREFIEMMGPAITHWMPLPAALGPADGESNG